MIPMRWTGAGFALTVLALATPVAAQDSTATSSNALANVDTTVTAGNAPDTTSARPFVTGGYDDKPYLEGVFGRIRLGGYGEANGAWERADGVTEEFGFEMTRLNLFTATDLRGHVQVFTEIEFEDGGEEIVLELAQIDLELHRSINARGGILLLPIGRFNLAHDAPRNELPRRPAVATELLGSALSQPGLGVFGAFGSESGHRATYEAYAVTGYDDGILAGSSAGTRLGSGKLNREDNNAAPAWVGRVEWSNGFRASVGVSGYTGPYNTYRLDGLDVDAPRDVVMAALDAEFEILGVKLTGEGALVQIDVPEGLAGLFASRQGGAFVQASRAVLRVPGLPDGRITAVARADLVDFDRDLLGDSLRSLTLGANFRPIPESVLKLAFTRGDSRDRFNNLAQDAAWVLGLATYF